MLSTDSANTMVTTVMSDIGTILTAGLTTVLATVAVLIGLFFVLRFIYTRIGRGK